MARADRPMVVNGKEYAPTHEDVLKAMARVPPRPIPPGGWYAIVRGRKHPLKIVVARTLGLKRTDFTHPHAVTFARRTSLEIGQEPGEYVR